MTKTPVSVPDPILRYLGDGGPGITRRRRGRGFSYHGPDGERITDPETIERIRSLAIPPAYRDVWICPDPNGHLQATGRDERGRKQYVYHPRWQEMRDRDKFAHMLEFAEALPRIRRRVSRDLRLEGLPRERVLAAVVLLLESTLVRVGNASYARENGSYGLTTIRKKHVDLVDDDTVVLEFTGKGGLDWRVEAEDPRIAEVVRECAEIPGWELFKYVDDAGEKRDVESGHVNEYLREVASSEVTAKDFRTWAGTVLCTEELATQSASGTEPTKKAVTAAVKSVASVLGNTPAVCRQSYVHPAVIDTYLDGTLIERMDRESPDRPPPRGLRAIESSVWRLLTSLDES